MRQVAKVDPVVAATKVVQKYLYPDTLLLAKKVILVPSEGFLWAGKVFVDEWGGPGEVYHKLRYHLDLWNKHPIKVAMDFDTIRKYKLHDYCYLGLENFSGYTGDSEAVISIFGHHKFVVYYDDKYPVEELLIMRKSDLNTRHVITTMEAFKTERLHIGNFVDKYASNYRSGPLRKVKVRRKSCK